jgi:hypothetical protein
MRRVVPLAAAIVLAAAAGIVWIGSDRGAATRAFDDYSIANTSDQGLSLAFRYLGSTGHRVLRLDVPLRRGVVPSDAVVIRAGGEPRGLHEPLLNDAEEEFVRGGGRMILAITGHYGPLQTRGGGPHVALKVFPIWPDVDRLAMPEGRALDLLSLPPRMHALYVSGERPVIAREVIGAGDLIVITAAEALQNAHLREHLPLLIGLAGSRRTIAFDETVHGFAAPDGSVALLKEWGFGPFLIVLVLCAVLIVWRRATRVGPAEDDWRDTRSEAVDLVRSLGALYEETLKDDASLAAAWREIEQTGGMHAHHR